MRYGIICSDVRILLELMISQDTEPAKEEVRLYREEII